MNKLVKVLHCVVNMNRGGAETFIMNLYRNIDRSKIQFDFLTSIEGVYEEEIKQLGGKVYRIPYITQVGPFAYAKSLHNFFLAHPEYQIVHSHMDKMSGIVLREAKRANVKVRIAHSHSTKNEGNILEKMIKMYYGTYINSNSNVKFACSSDAAVFLYKKLSKNARIIKNGIDINKFIFSKNVRQKLETNLELIKILLLLGM